MGSDRSRWSHLLCGKAELRRTLGHVMKWLETEVLFLVFFHYAFECVRVGLKRLPKGMRSTHTRLVMQLSSSSSSPGKPLGSSLLKVEWHNRGKAAPGTCCSCILLWAAGRAEMCGVLQGAWSTACLQCSMSSSQVTMSATRTWSTISEKGVSFCPADTFSWVASLTIEKPKNHMISQPIQTVSRSAQSFLISTAQFLKKIWGVRIKTIYSLQKLGSVLLYSWEQSS